MNSELLKKNIIKYLAILSRYIEGINSIQLYDINKSAEDFFRDLFNKIYGYQLININIIETNTCAIDLGDTNSRVAIQVTSDSTSTKIKYTIQKFLEKKLDSNYDKLIIMVITKKQDSYTFNDETEGRLNFNKNEDILDYTDIAKKLQEKNDIEELQKIFEFIEKEFIIPYNNKNRIESNEVDTILNIIEFITNSKTSGIVDIGTEYEPDPEYKIEKRFYEYAEFLKNTYKDLLTIYGSVVEEIEQSLNLDFVKIKLISLYLKDISVRYLIKNNNNPILALEELVEFFSEKLEEKAIQYDRMAIKAYLIKHIIKCNVFPNEVK